MKPRYSAKPAGRHFNVVVLIVSLVIVAAAVAGPSYLVRSSSLAALVGKTAKSGEKPVRTGALRSLGVPKLAPSFLPATETIATFASDCVTPRTDFILGETVCAITNGVTETNRFVNWCVNCPTIDHGGVGVTDITTSGSQSFLYTPTVTGGWKATIADPSDSSIIPTVFTVAAQTAPIATYASDCVTPKTRFILGETVCAKAVGSSGFRYSWVDPAGFVNQTAPVSGSPDTNSFTLPNTTTTQNMDITVQNVGNWRVNVITSRSSLRASAFFSVEDTAQDNVDLQIFVSAVTSEPTTGGPVQYAVNVINTGPNDATNVHFKDEEFVSATLDSVTQTGGLTNAFICSASGTVDCSIATLPSGASAQFLVSFTAGSAGATIDNKVEVSSATNELNALDNEVKASPLHISNGATPAGCVLECPNNMTLSANATQAGNPGTFATFATPESLGGCGTVTVSPASGSFFPVGSTVVTATSTGGGLCSFTITVIETAAPTISCQGDLTQAADPGSGEASVPVDNPTFTGNNASLVGVRSDNRAVSDPYPIGTTTITWTVRECNDPPQCDDPNIRTASCTQHVTVTSADAPTISCPSDKTFDAGNDCQKTLTTGQIGTPTAGPTSGAHAAVVTSRRSDNLDLTDPYPAGQTVITWTAANDIGQASCTQTITITSTGDTTPPTLTVPPDVDVTVNACSTLLDDELGVATATDNCSTVNIARVGVPTVPCPIPGNPGRVCETFVFPVGTTDITYTATDAAGNSVSGVQHVTVHDLTPPTFTFVPPAVTVNTGPGATSCGALVSDATLGTAIISDDCDTTVIRTGVPAGNNFPVGTTVITYQAKADLSVTATQIVTVIDNTPPVLNVPGAVTAYTGPGATSCDTVVSDATLGTATATDNCPGIGAISRTGVPSGNVFPVGTTTINYSVTDAHGNTSTGTQVVTVIDNTPPTITLNGQTPSMWPPNHKYQTFAVTNFVTSVSDNCGNVSVGDVRIDHVTSDETENGNGDGNTVNDIVIAADCKSVQLRSERQGGGDGRIYTIYFRLTDSHGNTTTVTAKVVVAHNPGETPIDSGVNYTVNGGCS